MSVTITLHVFSGSPNPCWELTDSQVAELVARLSRADRTTLQKPPGIVGGLGYRGFSIEAVRERSLPARTYLHDGIVDLERFDANLLLGNADVERWLLSTAGDAVEEDVVQHIEAELGRDTDAGTEVQPAPAVLAVPPYNPGKWNNNPTIQRNNNCYNYANDRITNSFAQPGRGSGSMYSSFGCTNVGTAAQRDGQRPVSSASSTPSQGHFVALVIWPGRDYHWYRLDANGRWSHKPGQTPARNTDNSGRRISDPRSCDRGPYTTWCGYYHCIPSNTRIR